MLAVAEECQTLGGLVGGMGAVPPISGEVSYMFRVVDVITGNQPPGVSPRLMLWRGRGEPDASALRLIRNLGRIGRLTGEVFPNLWRDQLHVFVLST